MTPVSVQLILPAKVPAPKAISWIITGRCNMRCVHCYPASGPDWSQPELSAREKLEAVPRIAAAGIEAVFISGGETLLVAELFDLIQAVHECGMRSWLCTNGSQIDERTADRLANVRVGGVSISLDGSTARTHDRFRATPGAFEAALNAIRLLCRRELAVNADYTATKVNLADLVDTYLLAAELGAKSFFIKRFRPLGRGLTNSSRLAPQLPEYLDRISGLLVNAGANKTEICFEDPAMYAYCRKAGLDRYVRMDDFYPKFGCPAGIVWLGLQPNGDITPCPLLNIPIGNVMRDDLGTICRTSGILRRIADRNDRGGLCGTCDERRLCGGCRAHAFAASGDCFAEDPFCAYSILRSRGQVLKNEPMQ